MTDKQTLFHYRLSQAEETLINCLPPGRRVITKNWSYSPERTLLITGNWLENLS
jgi:hypothetical protein